METMESISGIQANRIGAAVLIRLELDNILQQPKIDMSKVWNCKRRQLSLIGVTMIEDGKNIDEHIHRYELLKMAESNCGENNANH